MKLPRHATDFVLLMTIVIRDLMIDENRYLTIPIDAFETDIQ